MLECEDTVSKSDIFVCTTPTVVHDLFYTLLKSNKLFNKNVRTDHSRITQFDIGNVTIQENTDYKAVASTIERLNSSTTEEYVYHGQSIHRLAHEYYERNHDKDYQSQLSPQVADIFNDKLSTNTALNITLKKLKQHTLTTLISCMHRFCNVVVIILVGVNICRLIAYKILMDTLQLDFTLL